MRKLKYLIDGIKLIVAYCIASILKIHKNNRDIWLIGERKSEARDNGYHLFKYIRENHSKDKTYYIIDKNSKDLDRIKSYGNIIYADSFKHYIYYIIANKLVIAHLGACVPDSPVCWKSEEKKIIKSKRIFIQHGITKELIPSLMYENTKADLFICGAKPEYDFVKSKFGYPEGHVKYTGFARFDNLHELKEKKQILLMPTWRKWIPSMTWPSGNKEESRREFLESKYYMKFNELINSNDMNNILEKYDMKLIFYPHHEMQGYLDLFNVRYKNIIIAKESDYDVQELLKESKILITDYSSVAFDFAYMNKNIIYYQFDEEEYNQNHYQQGYFNYYKDGFGEVTQYKNQVIKLIDDILKQEYINYIDRSKLFFSLHDNNNCNRNYTEICKL